MKKSETTPLKYESLSHVMSASGFPPPQHPLVALINGVDNKLTLTPVQEPHVLSFYKISFRPHAGSCSVRYGQTYFDYNEGGLLFAAPNQIIGNNKDEQENSESKCINQQITLLIHPDFLLNYPLSQKIKQYNYFSYSVNEALHLSDKEKEIILALFRNIEDELSNRIDEISQDIVVSQIELLLSYAHRFYKRQFITRKPANNTLLQNLEAILEAYFSGAESLHRGTPSVQYLADRLNLTPSYLSDMLRSMIGMNTQQLIHDKLIEKAKEKLATTDLSVSEIAYELGFEHPQSFSKLFKSKTKKSPLDFRNSFN